MTNPTCKDCPERRTACHDFCPRFAAWREQHKAEVGYTNAQHAAERISRNDFNKDGMFTTDRAKNRAKTFPGIAKAMAEQWGEL